MWWTHYFSSLPYHGHCFEFFCLEASFPTFVVHYDMRLLLPCDMISHERVAHLLRWCCFCSYCSCSCSKTSWSDSQFEHSVSLMHTANDHATWVYMVLWILSHWILVFKRQIKFIWDRILSIIFNELEDDVTLWCGGIYDILQNGAWGMLTNSIRPNTMHRI